MSNKNKSLEWIKNLRIEKTNKYKVVVDKSSSTGILLLGVFMVYL